MRTFLKILIGIIMGALLMLSVQTGVLENKPFLESLDTSLWVITIIALFLIAMIFLAKYYIDKNFASKSAEIEEKKKDFLDSIQKAFQGDKQELFNVIKIGTSKGITFASVFFAISTIISVLLAFGGIMTAAMMLRQNALIGKQNELLTQQNKLTVQQNEHVKLQIVTAEAQRRSDVNVEIFAILKQVEELLEKYAFETKLGNKTSTLKFNFSDACQAIHAKADRNAFEKAQLERVPCKRGLLVIPDGLKGRIQAVSATAQEHFIIKPSKDKNDKWEFDSDKKPYSPQRGNLLRGLASSFIDFRELNADFSHSDLSEADLNSTNLSGANLSGANLYKTILSDAVLIGTNFSNAILIKTNLSFTNLNKANFSNADLSDAVLDLAFIKNTNFSYARLKNTKLRNVEYIYDKNNFTTYEVKENTYYRFFNNNFHKAKDIHLARLPNFMLLIPDQTTTINSLLNIYKIYTPWGEYEQIIKEQGEDKWLDLYAKGEAIKQQKLKDNKP